MGDDDIDAPALRWAGIGVTVPGAMPAALAAAATSPRGPGGHGAVREVCDRPARRPPARPRTKQP
jgi:3-deoxy-D-manno-octulosonate 8-phosphate phosphatase (KDO 8-P phosphatase)